MIAATKKLAAEWNLTIDQEFAAANRSLSPSEQSLLEADLESGGCRDDLVIWQSEGNRILLDGHYRYRSCLCLGVPFGVIALAVASREEALAWIKANQRARRNCTPAEISHLRGSRYEQERNGHGGERTSSEEAIGHSDHLNDSDQASGHSDHESESGGRTCERLAAEYGVSPKTIRRDAAFARAADTVAANVGTHEALAAILAGDLGTKKDIERLSELPPDQQREVVAGGKPAVKQAASRLGRKTGPNRKPDPKPPKLDLDELFGAFQSLNEDERDLFMRRAFESRTDERRMAFLDWIDHAALETSTAGHSW